ncbi:phosphoesterase family protein [Mycobacterium xenopi 4042]|uniref:Phosphoesterase family protein n=1 Tax=Mycobacterium xenopi 4042 TaxID=1299334 RepID=X7YKX2_MYCXE|nr:phosphoesterase family protein [Mycobacterium xenopi 4042]
MPTLYSRHAAPETPNQRRIANRRADHRANGVGGGGFFCLSAFRRRGPPRAVRGRRTSTPAHVVIVVEENRSQANIIGNKSAPYINSLAANGAMMTQSFAETHPSEPNYLALFAGNMFGLKDNSCPVNVGAAPNLGSELLAAGYTFAGFAEDLPAVGSPVCSAANMLASMCPGWISATSRRTTRCRFRLSLRHRITLACLRFRSSFPTSTTTCTTARSPKATHGFTRSCPHMPPGRRPTTVC